MINFFCNSARSLVSLRFQSRVVSVRERKVFVCVFLVRAANHETTTHDLCFRRRFAFCWLISTTSTRPTGIGISHLRRISTRSHDDLTSLKARTKRCCRASRSDPPLSFLWTWETALLCSLFRFPRRSQQPPRQPCSNPHHHPAEPLSIQHHTPLQHQYAPLRLCLTRTRTPSHPPTLRQKQCASKISLCHRNHYSTHRTRHSRPSLRRTNPLSLTLHRRLHSHSRRSRSRSRSRSR